MELLQVIPFCTNELFKLASLSLQDLLAKKLCGQMAAITHTDCPCSSLTGVSLLQPTHCSSGQEVRKTQEGYHTEITPSLLFSSLSLMFNPPPSLPSLPPSLFPSPLLIEDPQDR